MTFPGRSRLNLLRALAGVLLSFSVLLVACGGSSNTGSTTAAPAGSTAKAAGAGATPTPSAVTRVAPSSSTTKTGLTLGTTQLTKYSDTVCDFAPAIARDGSHVAFVRATRSSASDSCPTTGTVEVVAADGSGLKDLGAGTAPFFSSDGGNIGFFQTPIASGCFPGVQIVTAAAAAVATIPGSFSATEANDPLSPDGKTLLLKACTGGATTLIGVDGKPGPAFSFPDSLQLGTNPVVSPFGWTPNGKGVVVNASAKFLLLDPGSGAVSQAPAGSITLIEARTPWEFQLDLWNPSLPLQFQ